jgi:hypothetical protein
MKINAEIPIWTVIQIDWEEKEYAVTTHLGFNSAYDTLANIYVQKSKEGRHAEIVVDGFISGEGWEAKIEEHSGECHAELHGYAVPSN